MPLKLYEHFHSLLEASFRGKKTFCSAQSHYFDADIVDYFIIKELILKPLQCRASLEFITYIHLFWFFEIKFQLPNK